LLFYSLLLFDVVCFNVQSQELPSLHALFHTWCGPLT
jgi:hypothetical protein